MNSSPFGSLSERFVACRCRRVRFSDSFVGLFCSCPLVSPRPPLRPFVRRGWYVCPNSIQSLFSTSFHASVRPSVCPYVHIPQCLLLRPSVHPFVGSSVLLFVRSCVRLSGPSVCQSVDQNFHIPTSPKFPSVSVVSFCLSVRSYIRQFALVRLCNMNSPLVRSSVRLYADPSVYSSYFTYMPR